MRKIYLLSFILAASTLTLNAQSTLTGFQANAICKGASSVTYNGTTKAPSFITFNEKAGISRNSVFSAMEQLFKIREGDQLREVRTQKDELGFTHIRFQQYYSGIKVQGGEYILHERNGAVTCINGSWIQEIQMNTVPSIAENSAIQSALNYLHADRYKWQMPEEEARIKYISKDAGATFYPKPELVIVARNFDLKKNDLHLCYKFDVYADAPLSRNWFYVDAVTGEIIAIENRICTTDVNCTANTMYSGTQNIVGDFVSANNYRLREAGRGQGVETYNLQQGTNYGNAVDFTSTSTLFNTTTNQDNAAYDAHWGAEGTYDYYVLVHNRNGIDNNGMKMMSYVHYSTGYNNAFWDGTEMTYGDGSGTPGNFNPLTAIDVCGHEFTHGVTENTAALVYSYESGALNESFSDIMGTNIEWYKKPSTGDFLIGEEIMVTPNTALRNMGNPNQYGDPDTYMGTNWYTGTADNGGVHTNSGVQNFWYYLLCNGGSGTNDVGNNYNVTGIGIASGEKIVFRSLTMYLTANSQYIDARTCSIQAAQDLFGACSPEVIATTNAWYAVNVGAAFSATVTASFNANMTTSCSVPFTVNFTNTSVNATNATWYFGDNTTSTQTNPSHTYTNAGTYTVSLVMSGACGTDSVAQVGYIVVNPPAAPTTVGGQNCTPASFTLTASGNPTLNWFTTSTGGTPFNTGTTYVTPVLNNTTTYYVESDIAGPSGNVPPANNTIGGGGNHNSTNLRYEIFDVLQPCTLVSVLVYSSVAGVRTINLWDNAGNLIQSWTPNIPNGTSTVTLNAPLNPGTGYRLGGISMNLYRNNSGVSYPYTYPNYVSITSSNNGSGSYYFFYNWLIQAAPCTSARTPVTAVIGPVIPVTYSTAPYDTLCTGSNPVTLTGGSPANGTYSGTGVSNGVFDPAVAGAGDWTITYTFVDANNCTGTATQVIHVDVCSGVNSPEQPMGVNIYPNPSKGNVTLELGMIHDGAAQINVLNALGQVMTTQENSLKAGNTKVQIDLSGLAKGIYFVRIKTSTEVVTRKIILE